MFYLFPRKELRKSIEIDWLIRWICVEFVSDGRIWLLLVEERLIDDKYIDWLMDCDGWIGAPPPGGAGIHIFHVTTQTIIFNTWGKIMVKNKEKKGKYWEKGVMRKKDKKKNKGTNNNKIWYLRGEKRYTYIPPMQWGPGTPGGEFISADRICYRLIDWLVNWLIDWLG